MTSLSSTIGDLGPIQKPITSAWHAPGGVYSNPDLYKMEQEKLFLSEWIMVAREEEIAKAGDYIATRIFDEPLLLTRDSDGVLHAFANICRHRGVEVAFGAGNAKLFTCPYHGWSYRLDGTLLGAPTATENLEFDRRNCRLPDIALGVWGGNVFVNFSKDPPPFEEFEASLEKRFSYLHPERCRIGAKEIIAQGCNWKFTVENLVDFYHVQVLHIGTLGKEFDLKVENIQSDAGWIDSTYKGAPSTPDGKSRFPQLPWLEGYGNDYAISCRIPPNMHLFARIDQIVIMNVWPSSVDKCDITCYILFPEEVTKLPEFEENVKIYTGYLHQIIEEDNSAVESLQAATLSRNYCAGPVVPLEKAVYDIANDYLQRMGLAGAPSLNSQG